MNSLRNSSRLAGGISSTFLDSPFVWKNVFSKIISLSVFARAFLFSWSSIKSSIVPSWRANRGISSAIFFIQLKKPASFHRRVYLRIPWWCKIVRASDWTNDLCSLSFRFLIGKLRISYEFFAPFLLWVNLGIYKIKIIFKLVKI